MPTKEKIKYNTNRYRNIHKNLRYRYGKADRCESVNCEGKSKRFDWALRKGREYSMDINDYEMLCRSCHCKQDMVKGENHCEAKLDERAVRFIKLNAGKITQRELAEKFGVVRQTISLIVTNKNWKHISV